MLSDIQQFINLVDRANNILVCFKREFGFDDVCAASGLVEFLEKQSKKVLVVCDSFEMPTELSFIKQKESVAGKLKNLQSFIINLDLEQKKISEFSYDVQDNKLKIYILPESGEIDESSVSFDKSKFRFDLIITIGAGDLESLGKIFSVNTDFFFNTTIINIDTDLKNENYGQLNLVDPNRAANSELVFEIIKQVGEDFVDENLATYFLAGIIARTKSFKTENINPQTLKNVAELIALGADKEKILNNFYRTKKVSTLRLWGRVLARLQFDPQTKFVWSSLPYTDFVKSGANEEAVKGIVDELILNSPQAESVLLVYEKKDGQIGFELYTSPKYDSKYLLNNYEVAGTRNFVKGVLKDKKLKEVENELVSVISEKLKMK